MEMCASEWSESWKKAPFVSTKAEKRRKKKEKFYSQFEAGEMMEVELKEKRNAIYN